MSDALTTKPQSIGRDESGNDIRVYRDGDGLVVQTWREGKGGEYLSGEIRLDQAAANLLFKACDEFFLP